LIRVIKRHEALCIAEPNTVQVCSC
jgi:hypothetical protein